MHDVDTVYVYSKTGMTFDVLRKEILLYSINKMLVVLVLMFFFYVCVCECVFGMAGVFVFFVFLQ